MEQNISTKEATVKTGNKIHGKVRLCDLTVLLLARESVTVRLDIHDDVEYMYEAFTIIRRIRGALEKLFADEVDLLR